MALTSVARNRIAPYTYFENPVIRIALTALVAVAAFYTRSFLCLGLAPFLWIRPEEVSGPTSEQPSRATTPPTRAPNPAHLSAQSSRAATPPPRIPTNPSSPKNLISPTPVRSWAEVAARAFGPNPRKTGGE